MTRRRRGYDDNVTHPSPRLRCMTTCPRSWWHRWRAHLGPASPPRTTHRAAHRCRVARPVRSCFIWRRSPWTSPSSCTSTRPAASSPRASPSTIRCSTSNLRSPPSASGRCVPDIYVCVCTLCVRQARSAGMLLLSRARTRARARARALARTRTRAVPQGCPPSRRA